MPRVRIVGPEGVGVQVDRHSYFPGQEVDLSERWAAILVALRKAVPVAPMAEMAEAPVSRDPVVQRRRR